jgi:CBS domain-containing protein
MTVRDLMRSSPKSCAPTTNLAAVTELLWCCGCGALPVVDSRGRVLGIVTDRDICMALGTKDRRPSELVAEQVMSREIATCRASDEIHTALKVMRARKVRRLPVLNADGKLEGILCISDLILDACHDDGSRPKFSYEDVMNTLRCICSHHSFATVANRRDLVATGADAGRNVPKHRQRASSGTFA